MHNIHYQFPCSEEFFILANQENKPIFLSIGIAAATVKYALVIVEMQWNENQINNEETKDEHSE
jgi:uncharacterized protein YyaL (SSP411 family)